MTADWQQQARADYVASFPRKLETIETLTAEWIADPADEARFEALRTAVHRIHGTAGSYGFDALGVIVAAWDEMMTAALKANSYSGPDVIQSVEDHLRAFRTEITDSYARETGR